MDDGYEWRDGIPSKELDLVFSEATWRHTSNGWKWIFKMKSGLSTEEVIYYKAYMVAKGYSQKGVDYNEIFSSSLTLLHTCVACLIGNSEHGVRPTLCQNFLSPWKMGIRHSDETTWSFWGGRIGKFCLFFGKVSLWAEAMTKAVLQEIRWVHYLSWVYHKSLWLMCLS